MPKILFRAILLFLVLFLSTEYNARAQNLVNDTLKLTVKQAEDQFIKNNLQLIAQHFNIDNANAQILTARVFPNPDFNFSNGIYANNATDGPAYKEQSFGI